MQLYLHAFANAVGHLQIQPLFASVQAIDHFLVLQFTRTDHQTRQIASEKLSHVELATFSKEGKIFVCLDSFQLFFPFVKQHIRLLVPQSIIHMQVSFYPFWVLTL